MRNVGHRLLLAAYALLPVIAAALAAAAGRRWD
jgi:hypothetical protein